jgi:hypothetical protein
MDDGNYAKYIPPHRTEFHRIRSYFVRRTTFFRVWNTERNHCGGIRLSKRTRAAPLFVSHATPFFPSHKALLWGRYMKCDKMSKRNATRRDVTQIKKLFRTNTEVKSIHTATDKLWNKIQYINLQRDAETYRKVQSFSIN